MKQAARSYLRPMAAPPTKVRELAQERTLMTASGITTSKPVTVLQDIFITMLTEFYLDRQPLISVAYPMTETFRSTLELSLLTEAAPPEQKVRYRWFAYPSSTLGQRRLAKYMRLKKVCSSPLLNVSVDPLTSKVLVTQTDAITIFDGLVVDSKPTVNSGNSEKGKLWGALRAEQNSANAYVTAPAVDQRQVNEMVRSLANEMPAGVDLSTAKAWLMFEDDATINASYNIKSVGSAVGAKHYVEWAVPFKSDKYVVLLCSFDPSTTPVVMDVKVQTKYRIRTNSIDVGDIANTADVYYVAAFGELENE